MLIINIFYIISIKKTCFSELKRIKFTEQKKVFLSVLEMFDNFYISLILI